MTPEECLVTYGAAWFEPKSAARLELLRRCCTEDIVFVDPQRGRLAGLEAVSDMIGSFVSSTAGSSESETRGRTGDNGVSVEVVTPIDVQHGFFRYSFVWRHASGETFGGTDFCELADDGRMKLITVWPATSDFPLPSSS